MKNISEWIRKRGSREGASTPGWTSQDHDALERAVHFPGDKCPIRTIQIPKNYPNAPTLDVSKATRAWATLEERDGWKPDRFNAAAFIEAWQEEYDS